MKTKALKWVLMITCGVLMVIINFTLVYELLIPDICYYHFNEMNPLLNLFYSAGPASNGHPEPNILNFFVSLLVGFLLGYGMNKLFLKK